MQKHSNPPQFRAARDLSEEARDAALQYVRKISGSTKPSQANTEFFENAVDEITAATERLLDGLVTKAPPKNSRGEAEKRKARSAAVSRGLSPGFADRDLASGVLRADHLPDSKGATFPELRSTSSGTTWGR